MISRLFKDMQNVQRLKEFLLTIAPLSLPVGVDVGCNNSSSA